MEKNEQISPSMYIVLKKSSITEELCQKLLNLNEGWPKFLNVDHIIQCGYKLNQQEYCDGYYAKKTDTFIALLFHRISVNELKVFLSIKCDFWHNICGK